MDIHNINRLPENTYFNKQNEEVREEELEKNYATSVQEQLISEDMEQINQAARSNLKKRILSGELHKDIASARALTPSAKEEEEALEESVETLAESVDEAVESTGEVVEQFAESVDEAVESTDEVIEHFTESVDEAAESTGEVIEHFAESVDKTIQDNVKQATKFVNDQKEELTQQAEEALDAAHESINTKILEGKEAIDDGIDAIQTGLNEATDAAQGAVDEAFHKAQQGYASLTDSISAGYENGSEMANAWKETAGTILDVAQERWTLNQSKVFSSTCRDNSRLPSGGFPVQAFYEQDYQFTDSNGNLTTFGSFVENNDLISQKRDSEVLRLLFPVGMFDMKSAKMAPVYDSQMKAFFKTKDAQQKLKMAFNSFLERYSLQWDPKSKEIIVALDDLMEKQNHTAWLSNLFTKKRQIRIFERVIKCLSTHGLRNESKALHDFLKDYVKPNMRNRSIEWVSRVGSSIMRNIVLPILKILENNQ